MNELKELSQGPERMRGGMGREGFERSCGVKVTDVTAKRRRR